MAAGALTQEILLRNCFHILAQILIDAACIFLGKAKEISDGPPELTLYVLLFGSSREVLLIHGSAVEHQIQHSSACWGPSAKSAHDHRNKGSAFTGVLLVLVLTIV